MQTGNKKPEISSTKNSIAGDQNKGGKNELAFFLIVLAIFIVLAINYIASKNDFEKIVLVEKDQETVQENPFLVHESTLDEEVVVEESFFDSVRNYFDSFRGTVCDDGTGARIDTKFPDFVLSEDGVVCFKDKEISGIDSASFVPVGQTYFKDKENVYKVSLDSGKSKRRVEFAELNLDVETFTIVDEKVDGGAVVKDKKGVYYLGNEYKEPNPIFGADTSTFELFHVCSVVDGHVSNLYKDKYRLYNDKGIIHYIDLTSFEYLGIYSNQDYMEIKGSYSKDKNSVYFGCGATITDADVKTFIDLGDGFAKDDDQVWYFGVPIENADVESFESLGQGYAKDKFDLYFEDRIILEEDMPASIPTSASSTNVDKIDETGT